MVFDYFHTTQFTFRILHTTTIVFSVTAADIYNLILSLF